MPRRKHEFSESDKVKALMWCGRHCCLCGKQTGIGIEVAHLDPNSSDLDSAIPLCFDCHAAIGHYNREQPRGRKYTIVELKARRNQIYEQHTRHLVPPVLYRLEQGHRKLPDVGFHISNLGNTYPVKARIRVTLAQGSQMFGPPGHGHYDGAHLWNLNPGFGVNGHFVVAAEAMSGNDALRARIDVTLIDIYERPHTLLPVGYVHRMGPGDDWYFEPSEEALAIPLPGG